MARPPRLTIDEFERLVAEALRELPAPFRSVVESENLVIAVEEEPTDDDYDLSDTDDEELFGIYRGPMRTQRDFNELPALPAMIAVFRGPILRSTRSQREAVREIKDTLVHEIGHFFGLEDHDMPY